ncbi:MAG: glycosyltransferase [Gammaproteobacteria bacterium]|nr:glycosyltransferase [Gammaproteobacteria bacterium]
MNSKNTASVIIPAYNEEEYIQQTLQALTNNNSLEIIIVDNGSTDRTAEIARQQGVKVIEFPVGTIAAVRNRGVQESTADVLIFIDSDVTVTQQWHEKLPEVLEKVKNSPLLITGSRYQPTNSKSLLNKYWYSELTQYDATYINAGHLITSRELFNKIHGFSESMETAEDYDFCQKATKAGAVIRDNPELIVTHDGYPQTIAGFIQRERWHGGQDFSSWQSFVESKIAWVALLNLVLFAVALVLSVTESYLALPGYLIIMYAVSFLLTVYKFGFKKIDYMFVMPLIFYLYLCGRSLALLDRLLGIKK